MDARDRLQLQKMINANDVEDQTGKIRELKHSQLIKMDVSKLAKIAFVHKHLKETSPEKYLEMCIKESKFLLACKNLFAA